MPKKTDFRQWELDNNKDIKGAVEYFLKETTKDWRYVFWYDVYSVNRGQIKNIEPGFDRQAERTQGERLDKPLNSAVISAPDGGVQKLDQAEISDENVKFIMGEEDLIPPARVKSSTVIFLNDECTRCKNNQTEKAKCDPKVSEYFYKKYKTSVDDIIKAQFSGI